MAELFTIRAFREASLPEWPSRISIAKVEEFITKVNEWREFWLRTELTVWVPNLSKKPYVDDGTGATRWLALHQKPLTDLDQPNAVTPCRAFGCCACSHSFDDSSPVRIVLADIDATLCRLLPVLWTYPNSRRRSLEPCWPQIQSRMRRWLERKGYALEPCRSIEYQTVQDFALVTRYVCAVQAEEECPIYLACRRRASLLRPEGLFNANAILSRSEWRCINTFIAGLPHPEAKEYVESACPQSYPCAVLFALRYCTKVRMRTSSTRTPPPVSSSSSEDDRERFRSFQSSDDHLLRSFHVLEEEEEEFSSPQNGVRTMSVN